MTNLIAIANLALTLVCQNPDGWQFKTSTASPTQDIWLVTFDLVRDQPAPLPAFSVKCSVPQIDIQHIWHPMTEYLTLPPNWAGNTYSSFADGAPIRTLLNDNNLNRLTIASSEAARPHHFAIGLVEEDCTIGIAVNYPRGESEPCSRYRAVLRFDLRRDALWSDAIQDAARWLNSLPGMAPAIPPPEAYEPLYSTWYNFHQDVHAADIEAECERAAKLGMKVLIVDDGWQTDDTARGYAYCGDWQVSTNRFPDFQAHVARVQALGMKYLLWYSVPFIGFKSQNYARFKGKYLRDDKGMGASVLDPRFPEVRDFLASTYEQAMVKYGLDGFKLDFIDNIYTWHGDPAVKDNYAGRDCKSISEALDRLLSDIMARLKRIKPDVLVEFRQRYIGPSIRKYGNMMRAGDCPGDILANRVRTTNVRLSSPGSAPHADMLEWNVSDSPESAARQILSVLFTVIQYSRTLKELPPDHLKMLQHWIDFTKAHRETLLHGHFRAFHPQANYPMLESEGEKERIVAVYQSGLAVEVEPSEKETIVVNGTGRGGLRLSYPAGRPASIRVFDTFGQAVEGEAIPSSGYAVVRF
ncbi:MAG: glycoside hydrolase family 36 protein [Kiritimatiellia bacterium]